MQASPAEHERDIDMGWTRIIFLILFYYEQWRHTEISELKQDDYIAEANAESEGIHLDEVGRAKKAIRGSIRATRLSKLTSAAVTTLIIFIIIIIIITVALHLEFNQHFVEKINVAGK